MYCPEPFTHFEINASGDVYICCPGVVPLSIGNLFQSSVMDIWNSKEAKMIRKTVLDKTYKYCNEKFCALVQQYKTYMPELELSSHHKLELENGPEIYNLGYDRTCNIACRSCRTKVGGITAEQYEKSKAIQKRLLEYGFAGGKRLVVTGSGDPFASRLYMELFEKIDFNKCPDLKIRLFTNAMLLSPERWNELPIKNHVDEIYVSIDAATASTYEFLRVGAKFDTLVKRLKFFSRLRQKSQIKVLRISFVVQAINFREMKAFVQMGKKFNCDIIFFSAIRNWGTYSPQEFERITVHDSSHPMYTELLDILEDELFVDPAVRLNTLIGLRAA